MLLEKSAENSRKMKIPFFEKEKEVLYNDRKFIIRSDYFERYTKQKKEKENCKKNNIINFDTIYNSRSMVCI